MNISSLNEMNISSLNEINISSQNSQNDINISSQTSQNEINIPSQNSQNEINIPIQNSQNEINISSQNSQNEIYISSLKSLVCFFLVSENKDDAGEADPLAVGQDERGRRSPVLRLVRPVPLHERRPGPPDRPAADGPRGDDARLARGAAGHAPQAHQLFQEELQRLPG
jgi:hypothetical protein